MNRFLLLIVMCVAACYASAAGMAQAGESEPVYGLGDISGLPMERKVPHNTSLSWLVSRAIAQSLVPGMDDDMPFFWVCYMVENEIFKE